MCKGKAIAKRALFGSDRVGGDSRVVNDPTFELARRSCEAAVSDMANDAGPQMDCGRRGARPPRPVHRRFVPSLTRGGVKYGMLVRRCSVVNAPRDRPPRDDRPPSDRPHRLGRVSDAWRPAEKLARAGAGFMYRRPPRRRARRAHRPHHRAGARSRLTRSFAMTPRTRPASSDATPRGYSTPATTDAVRAGPLDAVELRLGRWWKPRGAAGQS